MAVIGYLKKWNEDLTKGFQLQPKLEHFGSEVAQSNSREADFFIFFKARVTSSVYGSLRCGHWTTLAMKQVSIMVRYRYGCSHRNEINFFFDILDKWRVSRLAGTPDKYYESDGIVRVPRNDCLWQRECLTYLRESNNSDSRLLAGHCESLVATT